MELLSIAGIIGYGLYNSSKGRSSRPERNNYADVMGSGNGIDEDYDVKPTQMVKKYRKKAEKRWKEAQVPKQSGIITPNMRPSEVMPFYTSGKTMNTNTDYKQRKMELFTGGMLEGESTLGTYRHKVEAENMFGLNPQGRVSSGGTIGNAPGDAALQKSRTINSQVQNNVLPTEQLRVGPGLGVGPDVAATGGFHQFYRQLPLNVNEYKLTQLPGSANHGASSVQRPEISQINQINNNPGALIMPYDDRPPEATTGAVLGPKQHGQQPRGYSGLRPFDSDYNGVADSSVEAMQARYIDETRGRVRTGEGQTNPMINLSGTRDGTGAYVNDNMEASALETQRGLINKFFMPAGPGGVESSGTARPLYAPGGTLREQYENTYYTGPAVSDGKFAERLDVVQLQPESRTSKRTGQDRDYTPGAGRVNNFAPAAQGAYGLRNQETYSGLQHTLPTLQNQVFLPTEGANERFGNKAPVENPRASIASLNIAEKQLYENKFNRDVNDSRKLEFSAADPMRQQQFKPAGWKQGDDPQMLPLWMQKKMKQQQK